MVVAALVLLLFDAALGAAFLAVALGATFGAGALAAAVRAFDARILLERPIIHSPFK